MCVRTFISAVPPSGLSGFDAVLCIDATEKTSDRTTGRDVEDERAATATPTSCWRQRPP
jgi:hypothetical protein